MRVTSGYRPPWLNKTIGGSPTSAHMYGCATDIEFLDYENSYVFGHLHDFLPEGLKFDQIIAEFLPDGWIHFGVERSRCKATQTIPARDTRHSR